MNPYAIISVLCLWGLSLFGVGAWQRSDGETVERSAWQGRDNKELAKANARILELEGEARQDEAIHQQTMVSFAGVFEKEMKDAKAQRDRDVAAAYNGAVRLRDPGSPGLGTCGNSVGQAVAGPGGSDGSEGGELSPAAAGFLLGLENDADDVVRQLTLCQKVVEEDRRLCGMK